MSMDKQNMISKTNYNSLAKLNSSKILIDKYHFDKKFIICFKCNKVGYKSLDCWANTYKNKRIKQIQIPKRTIDTNLKGLKLAWVSKYT